MKSAYELAMERLAAESGPSKKLTDAQKARIAEIDKKFDAEAAETKVSYESKIAASSPAEAPGLREEMAQELGRIEERRESEKAAVWDEAGS